MTDESLFGNKPTPAKRGRKPKVKEETSVENNTDIDELELLRKRATHMSINFTDETTKEELSDAINSVLSADIEEDEVVKNTKTPSLSQYLRLKHMKQVRIAITNMNPQKSNVPGEIFTVANTHFGTVKKFVPFTNTEDGYHVPQCIYECLRDKKYLRIKKIKGKNGERDQIKKELLNEFAIQILPPLTKQELEKLAQDQAARGFNTE